MIYRGLFPRGIGAGIGVECNDKMNVSFVIDVSFICADQV